MLRSLYFFLIFYDHIFIDRVTALTGETVRLSEENEFPFIVSLSHKPTSKYAKGVMKNHECSGSLITKSHVLTAALCLDNWNNYFDMIVKVGSVDWLKAKNYEVRSWITFLKWVKDNNVDNINPHVFYNVAIVTLRSKVSENIRLPIITVKDGIELYNKRVMTAGWDSEGNIISSRFMKTSALKVLEPEECSFDEINYPAKIDKVMQKLHICTISDPVVTLNSGDSGGPLLKNKREIIAINSYVWPTEAVNVTKYRNMHHTISFCSEFIVSVTDNEIEFST